MEKVKFLTQERCPKCDQLRQFFEFGLRNKYVNNIVEVKREVDREEFSLLVAKHNLKATPVLVYEDKVLTETAPSKVSAFLKEVIG